MKNVYNKKSSKKVIFLDRDGVINRKAKSKKRGGVDYIKNWQEFEFLPGAIEAIKLLSQNGYQIYLITNQPGIARGMMSEQDLTLVHRKMEDKLKKQGAKLQGIYCCLHGWDEGCGCRKPKPGLLFQAAKEHNLDLTKAVFIGDDERDIQAGQAAGCQTILVEPGRNLLKIVNSLIKKQL